MDPEIKNGNPYWLFLAIPVFFLVWYAAGIGQAFIAGFGAMALLYAIFVWIPDDEARKLNRKQRFEAAESLLPKNQKAITKVRDTAVKQNMTAAIKIFSGLIAKLKASKSYQGIIEHKLVPALEDCLTELSEWTGDETGEFPITEERRKKLFLILTHKDELFAKWQSDGLNKTENLTATFRSEMEMQSAGINIEGDNT